MFYAYLCTFLKILKFYNLSEIITPIINLPADLLFSVGAGFTYWLVWRSWVHFLAAERDFLFSKSSSPALGSTQSLIQHVLGTLSPGVKQLEYEADHSPASNAEVKNEWSYTSAPSVCIHNTDRNNFTFTILLILN
jgi:hypothetical protein